MSAGSVDRRRWVVIAVSIAAIGAVIAWIAASGTATDAAMRQPSKSHVDQLEQAAEAADKAGSR